jgi:hypothetical protein
MLCHRTLHRSIGLGLVLVALGTWQGRVLGQATGGGAGGGGGGSSTVSGGFTGGGGSGSTSVAGGFTGGGGSGSTSVNGGFTGSGSSSGASFIGGTTSGGSSTTVPNSANPFLSTYQNPLVAGLVNTSGQQTVTKAFGQAMYNVVSTATANATTTSNTNTGYGFNTNGQIRTPTYIATLSDDVPHVVHGSMEVQNSVLDVLRRSSSLQPLTPLRVRVDNGTVFLEGTLPNAKQKRLAENQIRLTRGVYDVVNNIEVSEPLPRPKTPPPMGK